MNAVTTWTARGDRPAVERRSFATIAEECLDDVYRYLLYLTRRPDVAEELTAQTFERALRGWHRFDPARGAERTWLCRLARTTALDHLRAEERRQRRERTYAAREALTADAPELPSDAGAVLKEALCALSAADREVVVLRVVLELDAESAARVLGISPTACTTRLSRALEKLERKVRPARVA